MTDTKSKGTCLDLKAVEAADANMDGRVSYEELVKALIAGGLNEAAAIKDATDFFAGFDTYGSKSVAIKEFLAEYRRRGLFQVVRAISTGKIAVTEGKITKEVLSGALTSKFGASAAHDYVNEMFKELDPSNAGSITKADAEKWYQQAESEMKSLREKNLRTAAEATFKAFDKDQSGSIDKEEFVYLCNELGETLSDEEVNSAMTQIDTSKDGVLSFDEFYAWFSEPSRSKSEKSAVALATLKSKLFLTKGSKWMRSAIPADKKADPGLKLSATLGAVSDVKASIKISTATSHIVDSGVLDDLAANGPTPGGFVSFDLKAKNASETLPYVKTLVQQVLNIDPDVSKDVGVNISLAEAKDVIRVTISARKGPPSPMDMVKQMVGGVAATVEFGYNLKSFVDAGDSFTVKSALGIRASVELESTPPGMVSQISGMAGAQAAAMGLADVPMLSELQSGATGPIAGDFSTFIPELMDGMLAGAGNALGLTGSPSDYPVAQILSAALHGGPIKADGRAPRCPLTDNRGKPVAAMKLACAIIGREFSELVGVHVRDTTGMGFSLAFSGLVVVDDVSAFLNKFCSDRSVNCERCSDRVWLNKATFCTAKCRRMVCMSCSEKHGPICDRCSDTSAANDPNAPLVVLMSG